MKHPFDECYRAYLEATEDALQKYLAVPDEEWGGGMPRRLTEQMRYSVMAGGKRLRPVMLLAAYGALAENWRDALPFAAALEMIHTYSLIHDDLPCMDNDDLRRGRPTSHKVFGEGAAVLTGDALLNHAFEVMAESRHPRTLDALAIIARHAGTSGMIAGQTADLAMEGEEAGESMVRYIQKRKTSDLFIAAVKAGLYLAGADEAALGAGESFALSFGLAFQISDDILDVEGDAEALGKSVGKDMAADKMTWPHVFGMKRAKMDAERYTAEAVRAAEQMPGGEFFAALAKQMRNRVR